jgi:hypothetical protein
MPSKPGVGTVLLLTSAVCREPLDKLIRRKLMRPVAYVQHRARRRCRPVSAGMSSGNAHSHGDEMMKSHEGQ